MARKIAPRTQISLLLYTTINLASFTAGVWLVMLWPQLTANAGFWITAIVAVSLVLAAPVSWCLAKCVPDRWRAKAVAKPSPLADAPSRPL
ncbi:MAG: hypothetical protein ACK4UO_03145 [Pseudolabrys sp.]